MSTDEIRYWLTELQRSHGWGFKVLGRTVGLAKPDNINRKANGKEWFRGGEQARAARAIERILAGELICIKGRAGASGRYKGRAVVVEHPVPIVPRTRMVYDTKLGRMRTVERDRPKPLRVP